MGESRKSTNWQRVETTWSDLVEKLRTPTRTTETIEEYLNMSKAEQGKLKDCGGFVGGTLNGPQRKAANVEGRDLITLDMDNIATGETENVLKRIDALEAAYVVYSTRSHVDWKPRLRVVFPLDRTITADEYEPIARKIGSLIGIELCDPTTFEASRLMYWPSCSKDSNYIFSFADRAFASADGLLGQYADWHDVSTWPKVPGQDVREKGLLAKQADPTTKEGIIGAFCRNYNIYSAIEAFIPNAYLLTEHDDRLTYTGGSTVAGAVVYDNGNFLYSHHATDPTSGQLVNAFDLVRLHRFGDMDDNAKAGTPVNKLPSFVEMRKLALSDNAVASEINAAMTQKAAEVFIKAAEVMDEDDVPGADRTDVSWIAAASLEYDQNTGRPKKTRANVIKILNFDPDLKGKLALNEFSSRVDVLGPLPWDKETKGRHWTDADDASLACYLETKFGIEGREKINDAFIHVCEQNKFNEVKDYLLSLKWDGVPRLDTVLIDYLGAEDNEYIRAVSRKSFTAAVARVLNPGCKYDYMPVFVGEQGQGKSTFLSIMGRGWFCDSLQSFEGKEAAELIQGVWIIEVGEMTGYAKSDVNAAKQFLSKTSDRFRQAYGRRVMDYPRRCVFFGTSNPKEFLKDPTGNRRFWPVEINPSRVRKDVHKELPKEVDQLWAEARKNFVMGETLYLSKRLEAMAKVEQDAHQTSDPKEGLIQAFIEKPVPVNYEKMDLAARRMYWSGTAQVEETVPRDKVCAMEIWCECLNGDIKRLRKADSVEINQILDNTKGWQRNRDMRRYGYCGRQRGFERTNKLAE